MSYKNGFVIDYDDTWRTRINCRDCFFYSAEDKTCFNKGIHLATTGYDLWKYCKHFFYDGNVYSKIMMTLERFGPDHVREEYGRKYAPDYFVNHTYQGVNVLVQATKKDQLQLDAEAIRAKPKGKSLIKDEARNTSPVEKMHDIRGNEDVRFPKDKRNSIASTNSLQPKIRTIPKHKSKQEMVSRIQSEKLAIKCLLSSTKKSKRYKALSLCCKKATRIYT